MKQIITEHLIRDVCAGRVLCAPIPVCPGCPLGLPPVLDLAFPGFPFPPFLVYSSYETQDSN